MGPGSRVDPLEIGLEQENYPVYNSREIMREICVYKCPQKKTKRKKLEKKHKKSKKKNSLKKEKRKTFFLFFPFCFFFYFLCQIKKIEKTILFF